MKVRGALSLAILFLFSPFSVLQGQTEPVPSIEALIKKVELRRGTWTGLKADIEIEFLAAEGRQASC